MSQENMPAMGPVQLIVVFIGAAIFLAFGVQLLGAFFVEQALTGGTVKCDVFPRGPVDWQEICKDLKGFAGNVFPITGIIIMVAAALALIASVFFFTDGWRR